MSIARFAVRLRSLNRVPCVLAILACAGSCGIAAAAVTADHAHRHPAKGSATLTWNAPAENGDGSALTNLAGFQIDYGTDSGKLTHSVQVPSAGATSYTLSDLSSGTWYFAVRSYTNTGVTSDQSSVASKQIK